MFFFYRFKQIVNVLDSNQLKEEISKINKKFEGIVDYSDSDLQKWEFEVEILEKTRNQFNNLIDLSSKTSCSLEQELQELKHEKQIAKIEEEKCFKEILEKSVILQDFESVNQKIISELQDCCTKPQFPPIFISQLPLEKYTLKCQLFTQSLDDFLKNNFKIVGNLDLSDDNEDSAKMNFELGKLLKFYTNAELKLFKTKALYESQKNITKTLTDYNNSWRPMSFSQMKKETKTIEADNASKENYKNILNDQMELLIKEMQEQKIEMILYENTKIKFERARQRFDMIQMICPMVFNVLSIAEIVWILMQLDMELFESISQWNNNTGFSQTTIETLKRIVT